MLQASQRLRPTTFAFAAVAALCIAGCSTPQDDAPTSSTASVLASADSTTIATGRFTGLNNHVVKGEVLLTQTGNVVSVRLSPSFSLDGAPDPKIGFGRSGSYDESTTFTPLRSKTGAQTYIVPASIDASDYDEVYIWCERFSVGLGVAKITPTGG